MYDPDDYPDDFPEDDFPEPEENPYIEEQEELDELARLDHKDWS